MHMGEISKIFCHFVIFLIKSLFYAALRHFAPDKIEMKNDKTALKNDKTALKNDKIEIHFLPFLGQWSRRKRWQDPAAWVRSPGGSEEETPQAPRGPAGAPRCGTLPVISSPGSV